jgi:predicted amino acid-binding ACT domain protein
VTAPLDKVIAKYGFEIIDVSKTFRLDELKQKAIDIINKYKNYDSLDSLKSSLKRIDEEIKKTKEDMLNKLSNTTNGQFDEKFSEYYYCLFVLSPLKSEVDKKLKSIEEMEKKKKEYDVIKGEKTIKDLEKFVENLKFKFDVKEYEREINKALGILIEDGLFAYSIWLESEDKEPHRAMRITSLLLLKDSSINLIQNSHDLRKGILEEISKSIEKTLLARQLLERMLIYARYRAKALQKGSD